MTSHVTTRADRAQFLTDILTTAVEGGITYWAAVTEYRWWSPTLDGGTAAHDDGIATGYATITDAEGEGRCYRVTTDTIAAALRTINAGPLGGLDEKTRRLIVANDHANGDAEHFDVIDADSADVIVQVACFGDVVYG